MPSTVRQFSQVLIYTDTATVLSSAEWSIVQSTGITETSNNTAHVYTNTNDSPQHMYTPVS